jgi:16S rRNA (uracil1498-N3)-methyltransferase
MPQGRFYIDGPLVPESAIGLKDEEMRHLHVCRAEIGDEVELVNGKGDLATGHLIRIEKKEITVHIDTLHHEAEPSFQLIIAQGIPKSSRLDTILEKGTELGMTFNAHKLESMQKILISAMKQCGRLYLPQIHVHNPIDRWETAPYPAFYGAFGQNTPKLFHAWQKATPKEGAIFIIGPESGLTAQEEKHLDKINAIPVSLHQNILRTDTAPLAALTLMYTYAAQI